MILLIFLLSILPTPVPVPTTDLSKQIITSGGYVPMAPFDYHCGYPLIVNDSTKEIKISLGKDGVVHVTAVNSKEDQP